MIHHGECLEVMAGMEPESVDAIVTDPPSAVGARFLDGRLDGRFSVHGRVLMAHRVSFYYAHGRLPRLTIDHLCNNRACVNQAHLADVSMRDNVLRSATALTAINARKTHCLHGHEFTADNTYLPHRWSRRCCRACKARWKRAHPRSVSI